MLNLNLLITMTGLALADAVNVCAFAVLSMVLIAILTKNPEEPKRVLKAGFSFSLAVFIMYLVYGLIIFQIFKTLAEGIQGIAPYMYTVFVVLIMIIGALNIKDYFMYKPGTVGTEMPLSMRPRVKQIVKKITSPIGAFFIGIFVTLFLLPCTIAPLIGAMNKLSNLGYTINTIIPWILYYNFLFILPMLIITLVIYRGFSKVENFSAWKDKNVKKLHLIAGILLFVVGFAMLIGWL